MTERTYDRQQRAAQKRAWRKKQAEALALTAPEGWVLASSLGKYAVKDGRGRVTFDRKQGTVTLQRGVYAKQTTLRNPDNYEVLVKFYLHCGYARVKDQRGALVLEKQP